MVTMTILTGPYAGRTRDVTRVDIKELMRSLLEHGWKWQIDWSQATPWEQFQFGREDMAARIIMALQEGRVVRFMDKEWRLGEKSLSDMAGEVEDAIVASGQTVTVVSDDEVALVIGTGGPERSVP